MNFTDTTAMTSGVNPMTVLIVIFAFVSNFWLCRLLTIQIVTAGYIRKHPIVIVTNKSNKPRHVINTKVTTEEFKKLFLFWFVPILGLSGLITLYITLVSRRYIVIAKQRLFLNHI